jgi:hypothetical protein
MRRARAILGNLKVLPWIKTSTRQAKRERKRQTSYTLPYGPISSILVCVLVTKEEANEIKVAKRKVQYGLKNNNNKPSKLIVTITIVPKVKNSRYVVIDILSYPLPMPYLLNR